MKIEQAQLDNVEAKLNRQNALVAVLTSAFWTMPLIILWYAVYLYNPSFSPIMLLVNGFLVGVFVRIHGKGMTGLFSLIAMLVHTIIVLVAFSLQIVIAGTTWALLLFGLYAAGMIAANKLSRIEVPFEEHRAYSYLTSPEPHQSSNKLKNRWWVALPILLIGIALTTNLATVGIVVFSEAQAQINQEQQSRQVKQYQENKEIDLTPSALSERSTHEVLLYAYAYHKGLLFNKQGTRSEVFPRSAYKAITLLNYLIDERDNARAKFIVGYLSGSTKGSPLIQASADQKDPYGRIYSAVNFGCYSDENLANNLLEKLANTSNKPYIKEEVSSILYVGIKSVCSELEQPEFSFGFVKNYSD